VRDLLSRIFSGSLYLFPANFRRAYGAEMVDVFAERIREVPLAQACGVALAEIADIGIAATRAHLSSASQLRPAMVGGAAIAIIATMLALQSAPLRTTAAIAVNDSIDFNAEDPAGHFTLSIRQGRPVAATIDRVPLPPQRLIYAGDSIRLLAPGGSVVLAVAYDRERGRIAWNPRPVLCRGRAASCSTIQ